MGVTGFLLYYIACVSIVYMDRECDRVLKDDGLSEHDCYEVRSDKKTEGGLAQWQDKQHVEECSIAFDFGDRLIALVIEKWLCEITDTETYLNMSADCSGSHNQFMVSVFVSLVVPKGSQKSDENGFKNAHEKLDKIDRVQSKIGAETF